MALFKIYGDNYDADIKKEFDVDIKKEFDVYDVDIYDVDIYDVVIYDVDMVLFRFDDVNSLSDILLSNINDATYNLR